jgi:DNA polymerase-1
MAKGRLKKSQIRATVREIANNLPQGGAADILKCGTLEFLRQKREIIEIAHCTNVLQVHDELLLQVREECAERAVKILVPSLEFAVKLSVPVVAEAVICRSWGEAKE